jgi:hypothetical protein
LLLLLLLLFVALLAGLELASQVKLAYTCGAAAFFLDCLTAFVDLLLVWSMDCEGDDVCTSIMKYAVVRIMISI